MSGPVDDYISSLRGKSPHTKRMYRSQLEMFEAVMGEKDPSKRTFTEVSKFIDHLEDDDKASGTIAMYTIVLRQFFEFHDREDLVKKIKSPTIKRTPRASVSSEWWMEMYKAAGFHDENGARNQALLSVLLGTGMRIGEAVKIKGKHVDWEEERIFVPHAKGDREVYYMMILMDEMQEYLRPWVGKIREQYIFPGKKWNTHLTDRQARHVIKKIAILAGVPNAERIGPHSLRHSIAKYMLFELEWPSLVVKLALNHKRLETTQIYTEVEEGSMELRDFVRRNRPGA